MKKNLFFVFLAFVCFVLWTTRAISEEKLKEDEIYVFIQKTCRHCWAAEDYLKEKHPNLKVQIRDIAEKKNMDLFFACGEKFNLEKMQMGTPLFCMGNNYVMGWSSEGEEEFEKYLKDFSK